MEENSEYLKFAAVGGGMTVIFYNIIFNSGFFFGAATFSGIFISLLLGGVVFAAVFFGMKKMAG